MNEVAIVIVRAVERAHLINFIEVMMSSHFGCGGQAYQ
jgi:hypothetical protein